MTAQDESGKGKASITYGGTETASLAVIQLHSHSGTIDMFIKCSSAR